MKKLFLLVALLFASGICYSQLTIGLKLSNTIDKFGLKTTNDAEYINNDVFLLNNFGLKGGIVGNYKFSHQFSIQSEIIFDAFRTNFVKMESYTNWQNELWVISNSFNVSMNYLEIPVMGKVSFGDNTTFDILAGGYLGYLLSARQSTEDGQLDMPEDTINNWWNEPESKSIDYPTQNVRKDYTSFNAGLSIGCGVTIRDALFFEFRINRGLINISKSDFVKTNTLQAQFSIGYYLFRQKKKTQTSD